jgi:hypothetical protein
MYIPCGSFLWRTDKGHRLVSSLVDFSSLPPRLLDLLPLSRALWPLPGSHKAAAEWTVCAQLWTGILPSWKSLLRYDPDR